MNRSVTTRSARRTGTRLAAVLLLALLAACARPVSSSSWTGSWSSSDFATSGGEPGEPGTAVSTTVISVSSGGDASESAEVTLGGTGAQVYVLGTSLALEEITDGRATLRVSDSIVTCAAGESVQVGGVRLTCTAVTRDLVTLRIVPA
jgi:hypothetical protein